MGTRAKVSVQYQSSTKSRNWALASEDLSSVFITENLPGAPVSTPIVPPSAADSSPKTSSDSGERSARLLDRIAPSFLLSFATLLMISAAISVSWGNIFSLMLW